jgi:transcriptional regulator with XRE-family HTH domain
MAQAVSEADIGQRILMLRQRSGLSIRQVAERANVTAGMISCIERGKNSPSISTLSKILLALGTDLQGFFGGAEPAETGYVIRREHMRSIADDQRSYTLLFPKRDDIKLEMLDELHDPEGPVPEMEPLPCDVAGYVIAGSIRLEIQDDGEHVLRPGDSFYIPRGTVHRGYAIGELAARVITVCYPPKY